MEIKIFYNGEELKKEASDPNRINDMMNEVRDGFPSVINNIEHISFLKDIMKHGE
jgi:acetylglutamate synthase